MKKLLILALLIFVPACAKNIPSGIDAGVAVAIKNICTPIYGRADDWDKISDDLARNIWRHNRTCAEYSMN